MSQISATPNTQIMAAARAALSGRWGVAVGMTAIFLAITLIGNQLGPFGFVLNALIWGPFAMGMASAFLRIVRGETVRVSQIFVGFDRFATCLAAYLLTTLFILLWMLLLIVPGVIAALSYAMTFYILADEPNIGARAALQKSKIMMFGNKWKFFCLGCRFIGWWLLGCITLGIGFLWVMPYMNSSFARFYLDVRDLSAEPSISTPGLAYGFDDQ